MTFTHLLHAFAPANGGVQLWVEVVKGHAVVPDPRDVEEGELPAALLPIVQARPARGRQRNTLATPKGKVVHLEVPTQAYTPEEAVDLMIQLCTVVNEEGTDGLSPELVYLCDLFAFADSLVRSGRIMFRADRVEQEWYPRWVVSAAGDHHPSLQRFKDALPGVLRSNGTDVDDLLDDFVHWITVRYLRDNQELQGEITVDFVEALVHGTAARRVTSETVISLNEWRRTAARDATQLTLMLSSPQDTVEVLDEPRWRLDIAMSVNDGPVEPLVAAQTPAATREIVVGLLDNLVKAWPELKDSLGTVYSWAHRGVWFPGPDIITGDTMRDRMVGIGLRLEHVADFLDHKAAELKSRGINIMIPREWTKQRPSVRVRTSAVGQGPGSGKLGLEQIMNFDVDISMDGKVLDSRITDELLHSASSIVNINGEYVHLDQDTLRRARAWLNALTESAEKTDGDGVTLRDVLEANAASGEKKESEHAFRVLNEGWVKQLLDSDNEVGPPERLDVPEEIVTPLRDHQVRGLNWLAWMFRHRLGAILADDMGLGKTLQVLALLAWERAENVVTGPTLVIAPTSVLNAWLAEAQRHVPSLRVLIDHGSSAPAELGWEQGEAPDLVVTSYGRVARNPERFQAVHWGRVVADEAQAIKNPNTKQSRAVRSIVADHHIALTGTPVENRLSDLYAIMDFANPGILGSAPAFQNRLAIPIERYQDPDATARLRNLVQPFILRRLKTDASVGLDLPPKQEIIESVSLSAEQAALYEAYIDRLELEMKHGSKGRRAMILGALVRIKQICNHPAHFAQDGSGILKDGKHRSHRVQRIFEILDQAKDDGRKALLFTQFPSFGKILIPELEKHFEMEIPMLYGELSRTQRAKLVEDFQSPDGPQFMVLSVKAGGTGITLTEASVVIHIDRWWNPAVEDQATDRAYRIGQNKDVTVYKMVAKGTLDERINDVILGKRELAGNVVGSGEGWIADLSDAELSELWTLRESSEESLEGGFDRG